MKKFFGIVMTVCVLICFTVCVDAVESSDVLTSELYSVDEFDVDSIKNALPESVREALPDGDIFSPEDFSDRFSAEYFFGFISSVLRSLIGDSVKTMAFCLGLVIIASALGSVRGMLHSAPLSALLEFVSSLCIMLALYGSITSLVGSVKVYLGQLTTLIGAMVPVMVSVSVAGGNVTASAVSANAMILGVAFVETITAGALFPVLQLCFGISVASGMGGMLRLGGISKLIRSVITWILGLIGAVISAVMTFQTSIAVHADSLSMRALRFAASNAVPVVGGMAGDAVSAVAGSITLIKSTVGWVGVIIISVMTLPVIMNIILTRLGITVVRTAADVLGAERERGVLDEMCGLLGFLAAVCVISAIMFVYALTLFAGSAAALAS